MCQNFCYTLYMKCSIFTLYYIHLLDFSKTFDPKKSYPFFLHPKSINLSLHPKTEGEKNWTPGLHWMWERKNLWNFPWTSYPFSHYISMSPHNGQASVSICGMLRYIGGFPFFYLFSLLQRNWSEHRLLSSTIESCGRVNDQDYKGVTRCCLYLWGSFLCQNKKKWHDINEKCPRIFYDAKLCSLADGGPRLYST